MLKFYINILTLLNSKIAGLIWFCFTAEQDSGLRNNGKTPIENIQARYDELKTENEKLCASLQANKKEKDKILSEKENLLKEYSSGATNENGKLNKPTTLHLR